MFDKLKNLFKNTKYTPTGKEGTEPWVNVVNTNFDGENPNQGFMELEWNKPFIDFLRKHGYQGATDEAVVDKWFTDLCKNIGGQMDEETKFVANADVLPKRRKKVDKNNQ